MMTATTLTRRTRKVHPGKSRRRSKVEEATRRNIVKGLVKMVTDPTLMRDGELVREIGMILCPSIKGEPEVHLRRCSTLTTTMILDIQRAMVEAATDSQLTDTEAPQLSLSDLARCPRTTIVEALPHSSAEMDHHQDHQQGTSKSMFQEVEVTTEVLSEADQDHHQEEATWALATSKDQRGQATTLETVPSEWTRSVTNHWKTCTVVPLIRSSATEPSGSNVPSTET